MSLLVGTRLSRGDLRTMRTRFGGETSLYFRCWFRVWAWVLGV